MWRGALPDPRCLLLGFPLAAPRASGFLFAGVTQLVECDLAKIDVEGSSPFSRSMLCVNTPSGTEVAVG